MSKKRPKRPRATMLADHGFTVRPCQYCGRNVAFVQAYDPRTGLHSRVCLDPTPPVYVVNLGRQTASRERLGFVSHHSTCTKFHEAQRKGATS